MLLLPVKIEMSIPKIEYYFKPGRLMKNGRTNPGILVVDQVRSFQCNNISKDKTVFNYVCNERLTVGVMCKAKAVVTKCEDSEEGVRYIVSKVDDEHNCEVNVAKSVAEEMRYEMKQIVRKEPQKPVIDAIRQVRQIYAEKYDEEDDLFDQIIAELGADKPLEKQLLRVRKEIIGKTPTNRDSFDPKHFLRRVFENDDDIIVLDSNKLDDDWRSKIAQKNAKSRCRWDKLDENMRDYEEIAPEEVINDIDEPIIDESDCPDLSEKDLPKRVLTYSTLKLLKLFGKHLKSSIDGTFKSSCYLWGQNFIWMVKYYGHWIPVVQAWLPDRTEESYKVIL